MSLILFSVCYPKMESLMFEVNFADTKKRIFEQSREKMCNEIVVQSNLETCKSDFERP